MTNFLKSLLKLTHVDRVQRELNKASSYLKTSKDKHLKKAEQALDKFVDLIQKKK